MIDARIAIYREAERRFAPWKNGGGETAEIVCLPAGASYDTFSWRISTARVVKSGSFSLFPGAWRSLTVIEGVTMVLKFADGTSMTSSPETGPVTFSGGIACDAELSGGPLLDLNVMVRAPHICEVWRIGTKPKQTHRPHARYICATIAIPEFGLARLDPAEIATDQEGNRLTAPDTGFVIDIACL